MRNLKSNKRCYTVVAFTFIIVFSFSSFYVFGQIEQDLGKRSRPATNVQIEQEPGSRRRVIQMDTSANDNLRRMYPDFISTDNLQTVKNIVVPQLVGASWNYKQISEFLAGMQLKLGTATPEVDNENIGIITSQSIPLRTFVTPFTAISITYGIQGAPEIIDVPQYIGLNSDVAIQNISKDYLSLGEIQMKDSEEPAGIVINQFPTQGMKVDQGTRINLVISLGPPTIEMVVVPQLVGRIWDNQVIYDYLKEMGLELGRITPVENSSRIGIIINQSPFAKTTVLPLTRIDLTYGIQKVSNVVMVGRYVGLQQVQAVQQIQNDSLSIGNINKITSGKPAGVVINQFPNEGMKVDPGTIVDLEISIGAEVEQTVSVPNLIGYSLSDAAEILKSVELYAGQFAKKPIRDTKPGTVVGQLPRAETIVKKGSVVSLTLSVAPAPIDQLIVVPNVKGMWQSDAIRTIKSSNLNYTIVFVKKSKEKVGSVVAQSIPPGEKVPPGTSVILEVKDKRMLPPWIYRAGALLLAGLLGAGIMKRKIKNGKKEKRVAGKNAKLKLKVVWDNGEQKVFESLPELTRFKLDLKIIPDKGEQTLKIN